ncbi:MAG: aminotransferase class I/II-fold pyridoxal phosphate-dependent enzyme [Lachnospiraceae bacterium]|nr:aminotransferase class I/II-fold pyridoxal phosphate-dependent enzyme [Lachnospiraceae bacterium]
MHGEEQEFVKEAFDSNWVAPLGANVDNFEKELAAYLGSFHGAALSSGTAAIHLALRMLSVRQGDAVFVSSLTFSATCNPIMYEKANPIFIDSEPDTWNMSPKALRKAFSKYPHPKAVIVVHLYGTPAKLDEIMAICDEHNVPLIEDAAESLGSSYQGKMTGTFGRMGILSFNGNKIITTSGGGMLVSDEKDFVERARFLSTQARDRARHYQHSQVGFNYRMSNIVAGIGRGQLLHLDEHIELKKKIYYQYKEAFKDISVIKLNPLNADGEANYWLSCITIDSGSSVKPDQIMDALEKENIECRPIWKPMHQQPVFAEYDYFLHDADVSADIFARGLCLPSDIKNTDEDMAKIITIVRGFFECTRDL